MHRHSAPNTGESDGPKDFEESLPLPEDDSVTIPGTLVGFVNPSARLSRRLSEDENLLLESPAARARVTWRRRCGNSGGVWLGRKACTKSSAAFGFADAAEVLNRRGRSCGDIGARCAMQRGRRTLSASDYWIDWWYATRKGSDIALVRARSPVDRLDPSRDGGEGVERVGTTAHDAQTRQIEALRDGRWRPLRRKRQCEVRRKRDRRA